MQVVVIGGGILGASAAWHLREKAEVTVVDAGDSDLLSLDNNLA